MCNRFVQLGLAFIALALCSSLSLAGGKDKDFHCPEGQIAKRVQSNNHNIGHHYVCVPETDLSGEVAELKAVVESQNDVITTLQTTVAELQAKLECMSKTGDDVYFTGCNVHIRNGMGATGPGVNGLGNLIVGYNEDATSIPVDPPLDPSVRTGSHNIVVGPGHSYTDRGGLVVGAGNRITAQFATVTGGFNNTASGASSSVSGGYNNVASGNLSSVRGGGGNLAVGSVSTVTGGQQNIASGTASSVSGGGQNTASGDSSSVSGGQSNTAGGQIPPFQPFASVNGGFGNVASGFAASVSGGGDNNASGFAASISGGQLNIASGEQSSTVSGGFHNTASAAFATVGGGGNRVAGDPQSWVAGLLFQPN